MGLYRGSNFWILSGVWVASISSLNGQMQGSGLRGMGICREMEKHGNYNIGFNILEKEIATILFNYFELAV